MRRKRMCPECGKKFRYMMQHLRTYHGMSDDEAKTISRQNRAVRVGVTQAQKPVNCPVPGCKSVICRVDKHLRQVHRLNKRDPEYERLVRIHLFHFLIPIVYSYVCSMYSYSPSVLIVYKNFIY